MKKGFTLIELLAVILILGIIALIAIPKVTDVINESKEKANIVSVRNYIKAAENFIIENEIKSNLIECAYNPLGCSIEQLKDAGLKVNGTIPDSGSLIFSNSKVSNATLLYSNYKAIYDGKDVNLLPLTLESYHRVDLIEEAKNNNYQIDSYYNYINVSVNDGKLILDSSVSGRNGQINFTYNFSGLNIKRIYIKGRRVGDIAYPSVDVYYGVAFLKNYTTGELAIKILHKDEEFVYDTDEVSEIDNFAINMVLGIIELEEAYIEYE